MATALPVGSTGLSMLTALVEFIHRLRAAAIPVSMVETLDAVETLKHVDLSNREQFRAALGASLVKRAEHRATFASLFDVYFAPRRAEASPSGTASGPLAAPFLADPTDVSSSDGVSAELLASLLVALRRNDEGALRALAALAVEQFGGI
ncbi:MAG TPA: hypothetical protein VEM93_00375, partial [Actinomycetota bacterium]|nr:hypothetical protein [Actinomycetota bacterium]